jgi:hypothetical protein
MEHPGTPFEPAELAELIGGTKDAIRMQLERLKRRGMVKAEQRVKQVDTTDGTKVIKYKVYLSSQKSPKPTPSSAIDFCSATPNHDGDGVFIAEQNAVQTQSVQRPVHRPNPDIEPESIAEQNYQGGHPTPSKPPPRDISIGDVCRYCGPPGGVNVSCWGRDLHVLEIRGDIATVKAPSWIHPITIPIHHLRKTRPHQ